MVAARLEGEGKLCDALWVVPGQPAPIEEEHIDMFLQSFKPFANADHEVLPRPNRRLLPPVRGIPPLRQRVSMRDFVPGSHCGAEVIVHRVALPPLPGAAT